MISSLSHLELNVLNYKEAIQFYDKILTPLGINRLNCTKDFTAYSNGSMKIVLSPMEERFKKDGYHRKRAGLNHLAFTASTREFVDNYFQTVLVPNTVNVLYEGKPQGDDDYYAVYFEGPDRIKLEVVCAPKYCDRNAWPSNIPSDYDPYL